MLDPKLLRADPDFVAQRLKIRGYVFDIEYFQTLEAQRKSLQTKTESLLNERNTLSKEIGKAKQQGGDVTALMNKVNHLSAELDKFKQQYETVQTELDAFVATVPNIPHESVPPGKSDEENLEIRKQGVPTQFSFQARDHVDLAEKNKSMDFTVAAKVSMSRFVVLRGQLARLQRALVQFMLDVHTREHGYQELYVPYLVNRQSLFGTGQLPKFADDQFNVDYDPSLVLIPTAEVPITNLVRDELLEASSLPLKYTAHTPCFRSEAGSYGKDTRGMFRQHQFEKVELVQIVEPQNSFSAHEELTHHAETILQKLGLPYRIVLLCGGDLGFSSAKTYDLEVWLPGQQRYREISSCSNFEAFQARRLQARYRNQQSGKNEYVHTLNGSGLAVGRTLIAIMENFQDERGQVHIPECLWPYMGDLRKIDFMS